MRMRLPDGREIQAVNPSNANLLHLMELKVQTREWTEDGKGLAMRGLSAMKRRALDYQVAVQAAEKAGQDTGDIDPPDDMELWMGVVLFLSRRAAGDKIGFLEAVDVVMNDVVAIPEPGDLGPGEEEDPPTPGSGGPATPAAPDAPAPQP